MAAIEHAHLKSFLLFQEVDSGLGNGVADKYFHFSRLNSAVLGQAQSAFACFDFIEQVGDGFVPWLGPEIAFAVFSHGEFAGFLLALANE